MKALRIKLTQNKANYGKEETVDNKMTYPLPPISTIIGAIHKSCGYTTYHKMDISISGDYKSLSEEIYTSNTLLNNTEDDRNYLIKKKNKDLQHSGYNIIAKALKSTGNSFKKNKTIQIYNKDLYDEYINLYKKKEELETYKETILNKEITEIDELIKKYKNEIKNLNKKDELYIELNNEIKKLKEKQKKLNKEFKEKENKEFKEPILYYANLVKGIRKYEVLNEINLLIFVRSDEKTLEDIYENIYNLTAIGRSEDFVDLKEIKYVEITKDIKERLNQPTSAYINEENIKNKFIRLNLKSKKVNEQYTAGTKYLMNKDYEIKDEKRIFNKKWLRYISNFSVKELGDSMFIDEDKNIIDFI